MATGWTQEQLNYLRREMEENAPPIPTKADKKNASRVTAMRASGTELGVVFNFGFKAGKSLLMAFNCVVAREFAGAINETGRILGWQKRGLSPAPAEHLLFPRPEDLESAIKVAALATDSTAGGITANFYVPEYGAAPGTVPIFFPVKAALEVLTTVASAADAADWWATDGSFELIPLKASQH